MRERDREKKDIERKAGAYSGGGGGGVRCVPPTPPKVGKILRKTCKNGGRGEKNS